MVFTRCSAVPVAHSTGDKILDGPFGRISSRAGLISRFFVRFSFADVDTYEKVSIIAQSIYSVSKYNHCGNGDRVT